MEKTLKITLLMFIALYYGSQTIEATFRFPKPEGPYDVGKTMYYLKDEQRREELSDNPQDRRELVIKIWYPSLKQADAKKNCNAEQQYLPQIQPLITMKATQKYLLPEKIVNFFLTRILVNAVWEAPLFDAEKPWPVIIFSHGFGSMIEFSTAQLENLASHGYVVIGIDHSYDCMAAFLPNNKIILQNKHFGGSKFSYVNKRVYTWIEDVRFVLDIIHHLAKADPIGRFSEKLDLNKIGMFGHSMGGATTVNICRLDDRVKAGVSLDGPLLGGEEIITPFKKPFMFFLAEDTFQRFKIPFSDQELQKKKVNPEDELEAKKRYEFYIPHLCCLMGKNVYHATLKGSAHQTFCDLPLFKRMSILLKLLDLETGTIDPLRVTTILNRYLVDFFDCYLKGEKTTIIDIPSHPDYPEVIMQRW